MTYAYDCHMHVLPINHIPLSAYLDFAISNGKEEAFAQMTTQNYVVDGILKKKGDALNLVNVVERRPYAQMALYEDDLRATYDGKLDPVINGGGICVKGAGKNLHYDRLVLCPQVMDFNLPKKLSMPEAFSTASCSFPVASLSAFATVFSAFTSTGM